VPPTVGETPATIIGVKGVPVDLKYTHASTNKFEVAVLKLTGPLVPISIYEVVELGKLTAVLLVGAFVTSAAVPRSCAAPGPPTPTPMFDLTARVAIFAVPVRSVEVAKTLVVRKLFENQAFPPTVRFAEAPARIPMLDATARVAIFAVPDTFAEVAETLAVVRLLENQALPRIVTFVGAPCWL
jgi:hypothetical protein